MSPINPFYTPSAPRRNPITRRHTYALLPKAPINASPVPRLTSLYHFNEKGAYGDRSYPGNCSGLLIKDLLTYYAPANVYDPMTGSGTCRDVCDELGIDVLSLDIHSGFDACDPATVPSTGFEFCWLHPPYWRQKIYTGKPEDLSSAESLEAFLTRYAALLDSCATALVPGGRRTVLMGDYSDRDAGFVPLIFHTKRVAFELGLKQDCTDIIRFSHGASSSRKVYRSSFIPGLHDVCMIFKKPH